MRVQYGRVIDNEGNTLFSSWVFGETQLARAQLIGRLAIADGASSREALDHHEHQEVVEGEIYEL